METQNSTTQMEPEAETQASYTPNYDDIARAAYDRYARHGYEEGRDLEHWLEAERDLQSSFTQASFTNSEVLADSAPKGKRTRK